MDPQEVLIESTKHATIHPELRRRQLARSLDELEKEATELERAALYFLNKVRACQGKKPVIVPRG